MPDALDIVSVAGSLLSLAGVIVAVVQIRKTRTAAEAARDAARRASGALSRRVLLSELSSCSTRLEELMALIRSASYEAALLRTNDLSRQLNHIRSAYKHSLSGSDQQPLTEIAAQVSVTRDQLERALKAAAQGESVELDQVHANKVLGQLTDGLNEIVGDITYIMPED